jgi:hypothetical protein
MVLRAAKLEICAKDGCKNKLFSPKADILAEKSLKNHFLLYFCP